MRHACPGRSMTRYVILGIITFMISGVTSAQIIMAEQQSDSAPWLLDKTAKPLPGEKMRPKRRSPRQQMRVEKMRPKPWSARQQTQVEKRRQKPRGTRQQTRVERRQPKPRNACPQQRALLVRDRKYLPTQALRRAGYHQAKVMAHAGTPRQIRRTFSARSEEFCLDRPRLVQTGTWTKTFPPEVPVVDFFLGDKLIALIGKT